MLATTDQNYIEQLNAAVTSMTKAMRADYADQFRRDFGNSNELANFKGRLRDKLYNYDLVDVIAGYENLTAQLPEKMPTMLVIVNAVKFARQARLMHESDIAAISARADKKTVVCNPTEMLAYAKQASGNDAGMGDYHSRMAEKKATLDNLIATHKARGLIRAGRGIIDHLCGMDGCGKPGTLSSSTRGASESGSSFFCSEHYRMI
jgi:hypothetical protein